MDSRTIQGLLSEQGISIGRFKVRRLMGELGLVCKQPGSRAYKRTTVERLDIPNQLNREFTVKRWDNAPMERLFRSLKTEWISWRRGRITSGAICRLCSEIAPLTGCLQALIHAIRKEKAVCSSSRKMRACPPP